MRDDKHPAVFDLGKDERSAFVVATDDQMPRLLADGYCLRALFFVDDPITVLDDAAPSIHRDELTSPSPYDATGGPQARIARTVIVRQARYLLSADRDLLNEHKQQLTDLRDQLQNEKIRCEDALERTRRDVIRIKQLEKELGEAKNELSRAHKSVTREQKETARANLLYEAREDAIGKLRELLGDELMDALLEQGDTLDAKALRRKAMDAIGGSDAVDGDR